MSVNVNQLKANDLDQVLKKIQKYDINVAYTIYWSLNILVTIYWSYFKTVLIKAKICNAGEVENVSLEAGKHFLIRLRSLLMCNVNLKIHIYLPVKSVYFLKIRLILNMSNCFCMFGYNVKFSAYRFYRKAMIT